MKIDKESLLLENDRICLRPLSIVDDHISRLSDLKAIRVFTCLWEDYRGYKAVEAFGLICFIP